jgi:hypothetical protein
MTRSVEENVSFSFPEGRTTPLSLSSLDSLRREDSRLRLRAWVQPDAFRRGKREFSFPRRLNHALSLSSLDPLRREDSRLRLRQNQAQKKSGPTFVLPALENTLGIDQ